MMKRTTILLLATLFACGDDDSLPPDGGDDPTDGAVESDGFIPDVDSGDPDDMAIEVDLGQDMGPPDEPCEDPGAIETVDCGMCGSAERFCGSDGVWEVGECTGEGVCRPGTTQDNDCGRCGSQAQRCTTECIWEDSGACTGEGECVPGETMRSGDGCGADETRELTCSDACSFVAGMCEADPCPTPGALEDVPCGLCGTRERFCTTDNVWTYGACMDEGVCMPGTTGSIGCGMCGMQAARCTAACQWSPNGACMGEGPCSPGDQTRTSAGCPAGETRVLECDAMCGYTIVAEGCSPTRPVDVLLLVDATGSNQGSLFSGAGTIASRCVDPILALTDAQVGLAFYGDHSTFGGAGEPFEASVEIGTGTSASIQSAIASQGTMGGADDSTLSALDMLAGGPAAAGSVPFVCSAGREAGGCWRAGSQRVIVIFTDEGAKSGPDPASTGIWNPWPAATSPDWTTVAPALMNDGTRLFVANDDSSITPAGQYEEMVTDLGGAAGDVYYGFNMYGAHCDAIVAKITALAMGM